MVLTPDVPIQTHEGLRLAKCFALQTWERKENRNEAYMGWWHEILDSSNPARSQGRAIRTLGRVELNLTTSCVDCEENCHPRNCIMQLPPSNTLLFATVHEHDGREKHLASAFWATAATWRCQNAEPAELASSMHVRAEEIRSFLLQILIRLRRHLQADRLGSSRPRGAALPIQRRFVSIENTAGVSRPVVRSYKARRDGNNGRHQPGCLQFRTRAISVTYFQQPIDG